MRHPAKIIRRYTDRVTGKVIEYAVYQVRGPRPGGGQQYRVFPTKREAEAYAVEQ